MNAERLRQILDHVGKELDATDVVERLHKLENSLQHDANTPGPGSAQTQVAGQSEEIFAALQCAPTSEFGGVWRHCAEDLGLGNALAPAIEEQLRAILAKNQLTPAAVAGEVRTLRESLTETKRTIAATVKSLEHFGVRESPIPADIGEIAVLIPRSALGNNLHRLGVEVEDLSQILNTVAEAVTGNAETITIESISSSDLSLYVWMESLPAKALAKMISELVKSYGSILEVREYREKLKARGLTNQQLSGLDEYARHEMGKVIDAQVEEIVGHRGKSNGKADEPRTLFKIALWGLAKRLDSGYNFDVRPSDAAEASGDESLREAAATIRNIRKNLKFISVTGERLLEPPSGAEISKGVIEHRAALVR